MSDRFLVETERKPVGIAVRVPGGFRFFCSDEAFRKFDGMTFARARALLRAIRSPQGMKPDGGGAPLLGRGALQ